MSNSSYFRFLLPLAVAAAPLSAAQSPRPTAQRVQIIPHFVQGATLRYSIATRTDSTEHTTTPILNPEGATKYQQSTRVVVRLDVLDVPPAATNSGSPPNSKSASPAIHVRATFEQAISDSQTDAYAPGATALDDGIDNLDGQSFDFTLAGGEIKDVKGIDKIAPNRDVATRVLSWVRVFCVPGMAPSSAITIGQKWTDERPLPEMPLTGLFWRNDSTYLRNEPCRAIGGSGGDSKAGTSNENVGPALGDCAVILTRFNILHRGSEKDATPDSYLHNGLRTSGKWNGSGESLDSISITNGLLVSSTQTATQEMDYDITSAASGSRLHHSGRTTTQTTITLLLNPPAQ